MAWNRQEVEATVADYFHMLMSELSGQSYNKAAHRKLLLQKLTDRTDSSVERKHQNISAILIEYGVPYISGYKPLGNYQCLIGIGWRRVCSQLRTLSALLYRLFDFRREPKLFDLPGSPEKHCNLDSVTYICQFA